MWRDNIYPGAACDVPSSLYSWIASVVGRLTDLGGTVEVGRYVADAYDHEMQSRLRDSVWSRRDSWYRDGARITTNWPGMVAEYRDRLAEVNRSELRPGATHTRTGPKRSRPV